MKILTVTTIPQETDSLGGPGQVPAGQGSAGSPALREGHVTSYGPGLLRGGDGYEEFLGGQSAGQRPRLTRLNYRAFLRNAFPLLPETYRLADEVSTVKPAKSSRLQ